MNEIRRSAMVTITICIATLLAGAAGAGECVELNFARSLAQRTFDGVETLEGDKGPEEVPEKPPMCVVICADTGMIEAGERAYWYDFKDDRVVILDHDGDRYREKPLESVVQAKQMELRNRLYLRKVAQQMGAQYKVDPFDPMRLEMELGLRIADKEPAELTVREKHGKRAIKLDKEKAAEFLASEHALPESLRETWSKLLLYRFRMHPELAKHVAGLAIPSELTVHEPGTGGVDTWSYRLEGHRLLGAEPEVPLAGRRREFEAEDDVAVVLADAAARLQEAECKDLDSFVARSAKHQAREEWLDSVVVLFEYSLATGDQPTDLMRETILKAQGVPEVEKFFQAIGLVGKKPEKAFRLLEELQAHTEATDHVLKIFQGNARRNLEQGKEARRLFLEVLAINPCIAGVWKDLGDILLDPYDPAAAWECWDTALELAPDHPLLSEVTERKQHYRGTYPERF
jgi:tetratricopeptide (TPR) repeat protein